ncbi:MAG: hypothetical protein ACT4QE_15790 [Anaerolineales bacterium]
MAQISLDDRHVKDLLKQAILELFDERRDLFYELFAEIVEDVGLVQAIREGAATERVSRDDVMQALEPAA